MRIYEVIDIQDKRFFYFEKAKELTQFTTYSQFFVSILVFLRVDISTMMSITNRLQFTNKEGEWLEKKFYKSLNLKM